MFSQIAVIVSEGTKYETTLHHVKYALCRFEPESTHFDFSVVGSILITNPIQSVNGRSCQRNRC